MAESMTFTLRGRDDLSRVMNAAGANAVRNMRRIEEANARAGRSTSQTSRSLNGLQASFGGAGGAAVRFGNQAGAAASGMGALGPAIGIAAVAASSLLPAIGGLVPMLAGAGLAAGVSVVAFKGIKAAWDASAKSGKDYTKAIKGMPAAQRELTGALKDVRKEFKGYGDDLLNNILPGVTAGIKGMAPAFGLFKAQGMLMGKTLGDLARDAGKALGSEGLQSLLAKNMTMGRQFVDNMARSFGTFSVALLDFGAKSRQSFNALNKGFGEILSKGLPGFFKGLEPGISGSAKAFSGLFSMINQLLPAFGRFAGVLGESVGPALGKFFDFVGKIGSKIFDNVGKVLRELKPLFDGIGSSLSSAAGPIGRFIDILGTGLAGAVRIAVSGFKVFADILRIAWPYVETLAGAISGALAPAFGSMNGKMGWLDRLRNFAHDNRTQLSVIFANAASGIMSFVRVVVSSLPAAFGMFRLMATTVLDSFSVILNGASLAFGWIPGIGPKIASAAKGFNEFAGKAKAGLDKAQGAVNEFSATASAKLKEQHLKMNITNWTRALETAKGQLNDPGLTAEKKAKITATIKDLEAKIASAKGQLATVKGKRVNLTAKNDTTKGLRLAQGTIDSLVGATRSLKARNAAHPGLNLAQGTINSLVGASRNLKANNKARSGKNSAQGTINSLKGKSADLKASNKTRSGVDAAKRAIASVVGKTVSIFVNVKKALGFAAGGLVPGFATGGLIPGYASGGNHLQRFPTGGRVTGPGTATSDSVNARLSNGEFVIRASSVRKYGAGLFAALNSGVLEQGIPSQHLAARGSASTQQVTTNHTTNVYPQRANLTAADLDLLQRKQEAASRIGRSR